MTHIILISVACVLAIGTAVSAYQTGRLQGGLECEVAHLSETMAARSAEFDLLKQDMRRGFDGLEGGE